MWVIEYNGQYLAKIRKGHYRWNLPELKGYLKFKTKAQCEKYLEKVWPNKIPFSVLVLQIKEKQKIKTYIPSKRAIKC